MYVRLDLAWTPFSWVANAPDVSCTTSSDIDSFSHQEAGGWGWCLLDPPALPSTAMTTVSTRVTVRGAGATEPPPLWVFVSSPADFLGTMSKLECFSSQ